MVQRSFAFIYLLFAWGKSSAQFTTGIESIINHKLFVVHSQVELNGTLSNTSNIYVIKGTADTVWIFGCGYGDSSETVEESDVHYYAALKNQDKDPIFSAAKDAVDVDFVIQFEFGFSPATATLVFIVPHGHEDHLNQEFIAAFFETLGYDISRSAVLVHIGDFIMSTCNEKCCGDSNCSKSNYFYRSPFNDPWTSTYLDLFMTVGNSNTDACNKVLKSFTSATGKWTIQHNKNLLHGGHTDGTLNLNNASLKFRLEGSESGTHCPVPSGYTIFPIHGNIPGVLSKELVPQ